ncbi:MAG: hydroxyacylglutathione hydrolase [Thermodesulfobacteriota bacterium]
MRVVAVPVLQDNYSYLVIDEAERVAGVVDCAEVEPVLEAARREGVTLTTVLSTHHHYDHVGGNEELASRTPVRVYGNAEDAARIPRLTDGVREGDTVRVGRLTGEVLFIPAHTSGHIAYHFPRERAVFTGDTLFAAGCGRLFEGDPAQMMASLAKLNALPEDTKVYCGHEYTVRNLEFAHLLEPTNRAIADKLEWARSRRAQGQPTVPSTIASERATNPFLRTASAELRASVQARIPAVDDDDVKIFAGTRRLKDEF